MTALVFGVHKGNDASSKLIKEQKKAIKALEDMLTSNERNVITNYTNNNEILERETGGNNEADYFEVNESFDCEIENEISKEKKKNIYMKHKFFQSENPNSVITNVQEQDDDDDHEEQGDDYNDTNYYSNNGYYDNNDYYNTGYNIIINNAYNNKNNDYNNNGYSNTYKNNVYNENINYNDKYNNNNNYNNENSNDNYHQNTYNSYPPIPIIQTSRNSAFGNSSPIINSMKKLNSFNVPSKRKKDDCEVSNIGERIKPRLSSFAPPYIQTPDNDSDGDGDCDSEYRNTLQQGLSSYSSIPRQPKLSVFEQEKKKKINKIIYDSLVPIPIPRTMGGRISSFSGRN
jgi:hypothetical protein